VYHFLLWSVGAILPYIPIKLEWRDVISHNVYQVFEITHSLQILDQNSYLHIFTKKLDWFR